MNTKTVAITVRFPLSLISQIDEERGSEPTANFIRRAVVEKLNGSQKDEALMLAVRESRELILKAVKSLVAT